MAGGDVVSDELPLVLHIVVRGAVSTHVGCADAGAASTTAPALDSAGW
jgi:hypothetical protein